MLINLGQVTSPEGFYIATSEEIYEGLIDPEIMTLKQLDAEITKGLLEWRRLHPVKRSWLQKWMPVMVAIAVGGVAVAMVAAPIAAAGAATAATQTGSAVAGTAAATKPITAAGAISMAQKGATIVRTAGLVRKAVTGKDDADRLIQAADIISKSPDVTTAAEKILAAELAAQGQKVQTEQAKQAMRERIRREQELYAEYMRRQAYELQEEITAGVAPATLPAPQVRPQADWATIAMAATPFILLVMGQR